MTPAPQHLPWQWRGHCIAWRAEGEGPALVLIHSIHAAASQEEWAQVVPLLSRTHRVFTLDLLGFGASDRPDADYSAALYVELVGDFLREVVREPATLVGSSLGGSYAIAVAARYPERVRALAAVGPAGVDRLAGPANPATRALRTLFRSSVPGRALFAMLTARPSIRMFLGDIYAKRGALTPDVVDRYWRTAHRPGARFAPAAFVGFALNCDVRDALPRLAVPFALLWGEQARQTPIRDADGFWQRHPELEFLPLPGGDLPHDEYPVPFAMALTAFLERAAATAGTARREVPDTGNAGFGAHATATSAAATGTTPELTSQAA